MSLHEGATHNRLAIRSAIALGAAALILCTLPISCGKPPQQPAQTSQAKPPEAKTPSVSPVDEAEALYSQRKLEDAYRKLAQSGNTGEAAKSADLKTRIMADMLSEVAEALKKGDTAKASRVVATILALEPKNVEALRITEEIRNIQTFAQVEKLFSSKSYDEACAKLAKCGEAGVGADRLAQLKAKLIAEFRSQIQAACDAKEFDRALELADKILLLDPTNSGFRQMRTYELPNLKLFSEAQGLFSQKKYEDAWRKLEPCGEEGIGRDKLSGLRTQILSEMISTAKEALGRRKWSTAREMGQRVLSLVPSNGEARAIVDEAAPYDVKIWEELKTLKGLSLATRPLAFSPDCQLLASGGDDKVRLWEAATGKERKVLSGHKNDVMSLAFTADGKLLASGSTDGTMRLWDVAACKEVKCLAEDQSVAGCSVKAVAISPDGKQLVSTLDNGYLHMWDVATGKTLWNIDGNCGTVMAAAFSPDGKSLATGSIGMTVDLWDAATGRRLRTFEGHSEGVVSIAFSSDGAMLASGSWDKTARLWDVAGGKCLGVFKTHAGYVNSVAFSTDCGMLATGSKDKTIKLWEISSGKEVRTIEVAEGPVGAVALSNDAKLLASGNSDDSAIKLWGYRKK